MSAAPHTTAAAALRLEGIAASRGERQVLHEVDLQVAAGEVVGLVGRNGAGKTTLLRVAAGLLAPSAGRVEIAGRALASYGRRALARAVALVPQETTLPFPFQIGELALMGRAPHLGAFGFERASDRAAARQALERLGIAALAQRSVLEVSGGERQLAIVARALVQDAPLLLLDEATAHLDLARRIGLLELARELAREGRAVLAVSHDLALAARFCDRLVLLHDGRVAAAGAPASVLTPERLSRAFGVEVEVLTTRDGTPVVVPRAQRPAPPRPRAC